MQETAWGSTKETLQFWAVNPKNRQWLPQKTYGGMIVENITQAVSRDLMAAALLRLEKHPTYQPVLSVHDEVIAEADLGTGDVGFLKQEIEVPDFAQQALQISSVTLGRPVKFSDHPELDRQAEETLRQAARQAGFRAVDFELEPVAAALDYERSLRQPQNVLIIDFGGGTLDLAVLRLGDPQEGAVHRRISRCRRLDRPARPQSHFGYRDSTGTGGDRGGSAAVHHRH